MENKTFFVVLFISVVIILTAVPLFYLFFNITPTGYSLQHSSNLCKVGCENSFIDCVDKCESELCKEDCKVQRGKCLFYC